MRNRISGYTLLETLIAFAIAVMVIMSLYNGAFSQMRQTGRSWSDYQISEIAHGILTEAYVTKNYPTSGDFDGRYFWSFSASPTEPDQPTKFDKIIRLEKLTVTIWPRLQKFNAQRFDLIVARPR